MLNTSQFFLLGSVCNYSCEHGNNPASGCKKTGVFHIFGVRKGC